MRPVLLPAVSQTLSLTLVLFGAMGCFSPQPEAFDVETLSFENAFTENDDIVIQPYEYTGLVCPDGSAATFYTVYREGLTEAAPLVILFHSGAFDYVIDPNTDDPLRGDHYRDESRLDGQWANQKIFETLGLVPGDGTEENLGALPAALADAGAFTLYPSNCWGDLWHNEYGYSVNDPSEGFTRNGRYLAWVMSAIASPDPATAVYWQAELGLNDLPIPLDFSSVSLVGARRWRAGDPRAFPPLSDRQHHESRERRVAWDSRCDRRLLDRQPLPHRRPTYGLSGDLRRSYPDLLDVGQHRHRRLQPWPVVSGARLDSPARNCLVERGSAGPERLGLQPAAPSHDVSDLCLG